MSIGNTSLDPAWRWSGHEECGVIISNTVVEATIELSHEEHWVIIRGTSRSRLTAKFERKREIRDCFWAFRVVSSKDSQSCEIDPRRGRVAPTLRGRKERLLLRSLRGIKLRFTTYEIELRRGRVAPTLRG